jgi:toxin FitB
MIVLDTNVVSELMRPQINPVVQAWFAGLGSVSLATTPVTVAEITFGIHRLPAGARRGELERRFAQFVGAGGGISVVSLDEAAGNLAGRFQALRRGKGLSASTADMLIAGVAASHTASLATRNIKDFEGLPLPIINPWDDAGAP